MSSSHPNFFPTGFFKLACIGAALWICGTVGAANAPRLCVDYSASPSPGLLSGFDVCIVRADAEVNLEATHTLGSTCLAQVDIFEVPMHSAAAEYAQKLGVPLLASDKNEMIRMDATHSGWPNVVIRELIKSAAVRGFDGFVLAGADSISQDAERAACLRVIEAIDAVYPDKQILLAGGFDLVSEARLHLDGLLITGVDTKWDAAGKRWVAADAAERHHQEYWIREGRRLGLKSYVVDFATAGETAEMTNRSHRILDLGGIPFYTTPALDGVNLGPLREISRHVLVVHSGQPRATFTAAVLHGSLEWLGYRVEYRDIETLADARSAPIQNGVEGVIFDQSLKASPAQQMRLAALAAKLAEKRVPLLLTGMPWTTAESFGAAARSLNIRGTGAAIQPVTKPVVSIAGKNILMDGAGATQARTQDFRDVRAPEGAVVWVSVKSQGRTPVTFDQVCITGWGGMWIDPLAPVVGPQVNPVLFLEQWLAGQEAAPVVDVSCQNGHRLLVNRIGGAGFIENSSAAGLPLGGEAMLKEILTQYALPFTVAVCEGDVRGWTPEGEKRDALRYQEAARAIYALPQVEAASESLSRPIDWASDHFTAGPLNQAVTDNRRSMEREIGGSLAYIHQDLLPPNKSVEMMLWPQGSIPTAAAAAFAKKMGVENLECVPASVVPGRVAPAGVSSWGAGADLRPALVNPRAGAALDAAAAIAEIQRTSAAAQWMGPAQVALTFEDVLSESSVREVKKLLDWCAAQPLQAITAGAYAGMVRDAAETRILRVSAGHWIVVNEGDARTLRLPVSAGVPDLKRSSGISGYTVRGDQLYVHTLGRRRTELVMEGQPSRSQLHLVQASSKVEFMEAGERRALLEVSDWRPVALTFAGLQPGSLCMMNANGDAEYLSADSAGRIQFTVPSRSMVQLKLMPATHAAMR